MTYIVSGGTLNSTHLLPLVLATKTDEMYECRYYDYQSIESIDQFTVTLAEQNSNQRLTEKCLD